MENEHLQEQVRALEEQIKNIKADIESTGKRAWLSTKVRNFNKFITAHQFLITIILGLMTVLYVQFVFDISPVEAYKSAATTKSMAEFYTEMGDEFRYVGEDEEAARAYELALKIQPYNSRASLGLAKAKIFEPETGQKFIDSELVDKRIDFLKKKLEDERFSSDFADIDYLKAVNAEDRFSYEEQKALLVASINKAKIQNLRMAFRPYLHLGYICLRKGDLVCATDSYENAEKIEKRSSTVYTGLGFCKLLQFDYEKAKEFLLKSNEIKYSADNLIGLGEVKKFEGHFKEAIEHFDEAMSLISADGADENPAVSGDWFYNYMPNSRNIGPMAEFVDEFTTLQEKKALVNYLLSNTYALLHRFREANNKFQSAIKEDRKLKYGNFFIANCISVSNSESLKPSKEIKSWLIKYSKRATKDKETQKDLEILF